MIQLIISLLILSGIGALLALLLEVADSYLADYGEKHILINEQKDLVVKGGTPLLFTLSEQNIFIPSACGGKGTCAYCKVRIHEGGGPVLPTETPYLSHEELQQHVRLSCQVKVKDDLKIEIPEEIFLVKEFQVRVEEIEELTPEIKGVYFKILSPEEGITFRPGQYVQLHIPKYKLTSGPEYRAYSICSSAHDKDRLDLVITKAEGGAVSTYVHEFLKVGEELIVSGPFGEFFLKESDRDILLVATGSGLAPVKSILDQIKREQIRRKTVLFFGAKTSKDLFFNDYLRGLEKEITDYTYTPVLSRATEEDRWEGEKGRVTNLIEKYIPNNPNTDVYLCGAPPMVESCVELLTKKGVPEGNICYDKFG